ncbi:MAG: hypothetical protein A2W68_19555 [Betaproteobacteria bacterium RIFCSPLOWO2_02_64_14]|nr:MAG: hypothetical protein A2W68_19555 [Betaproteobacteria bacterium RIFCSPLOWO2_02_64_14]
MTGENSFIRLSADGGKTHTSRVSHWRVLWCPAGAGHAMFVKSPLTEDRVRIYSDNVAVARWLQRTIETFLYPAFADTALPVLDAQFSRAGDPRSTAVETVVSGAGRIVLTWYDCIEPFVLTMAPGTSNRPLGVFSTFFPAKSAQIESDGRFAPDVPWLEMRGDRQCTSACLAWSETWVKPRG